MTILPITTSDDGRYYKIAGQDLLPIFKGQTRKKSISFWGDVEIKALPFKKVVTLHKHLYFYFRISRYAFKKVGFTGYYGSKTKKVVFESYEIKDSETLEDTFKAIEFRLGFDPEYPVYKIRFYDIAQDKDFKPASTVTIMKPQTAINPNGRLYLKNAKYTDEPITRFKKSEEIHEAKKRPSNDNFVIYPDEVGLSSHQDDNPHTINIIVNSFENNPPTEPFVKSPTKAKKRPPKAQKSTPKTKTAVTQRSRRDKVLDWLESKIDWLESKLD